MKRWTPLLLAGLAAGCGHAPPPRPPAAAPAVAGKHVTRNGPDVDAFRSSRPGAGTPVPVRYPHVDRVVLANGLTVYVVPRQSGIVSMSVVARGGAAALPAGKSGLAALTTRMMTEGTRRLGPLPLAEAVESLGTVLEHSAGRDFVRLGITTTEDDFARGLALLSEVVQEPAFSAKELQRVRSEWLDAIESERQSPARVSALVGLRLLLGPEMGAPVNGSRKDVKALTRADLVALHRAVFTRDNAALVVVGDVTTSDVKEHAERLFRALPASTVRPPSASKVPPTPKASRIVVVDRPGAVQSALFVVQAFPSRSVPGFETRELLSALLGGFFTSRINMNLRESHAYTYGARSLDMATEQWGAFAVMTSVQTEVTAPALTEIRSELSLVRDPALGKPIQPSEVSVARVDRQQELGATLLDTTDVAARVEELFVHRLPDDYYEKYPALLDRISTQQVAEEAKRVDPDHALVVIVGDRKSIETAFAGRPIEVAPGELTD